MAEALRLGYYRIQSIGTGSVADLSLHLLEDRQDEMIIFIPSVIAAGDTFLSLSVEFSSL